MQSRLLPELAIFPAFTPDAIRLAELVGSSTFSPPVSPTAADARELFASIGKGQTFFELLEARGLRLGPTGEGSDAEETSGRIDAVHCVDGRRRTLLHQACRRGNLQVARCLLFHGANASARCRDGRTPFHDAASSGPGEAALHLLKLLFEHDPAGIAVVDANGAHVLHLAAIHGNVAVVRWCAGLLAQPTGRQKSSRPAVSRFVIALGITSFSGRNMLHYAAYNGRLDVLKWLLGAENPRRGELSLGALDSNGYSVLHYAAMGAPLEVCEWLVLEAPDRNRLDLTARTSEGKTAAELAAARPPAVQKFLAEASRVPCVPSGLRCLGADTTSLGVGWELEPASSDTRLWETLRPLYFHLEVCQKPASLSRASSFLTMLLLMPPNSPGSPRAPPAMSSALLTASNLLHWEPLGVLLQPEAREHWLCGLEKDTEYLLRMRARNRNGFSGYSVPNLSGAFRTTDGGRRRSTSSLERFLGVIKEHPPMEPIANSFIGNLHFELLEARGLPRPSSVSSPRNANQIPRAPQGRYYAVVSMETPSTPDVECSGKASARRLIYCVRSALATLQQDLVLSGTSQVWRHPRFALRTVFRAPESLAHTRVTIAVRHETQGQFDSHCVGSLALTLLDLVQGMPAKLQWLPLVNVTEPGASGGLVLLRTLFLPNGVSELPHPTMADTWGATAEELLSSSQGSGSPEGGDAGSPPGSSSSTASTSSSSSSCSQFSHASVLVDRLGFGVFDPDLQLRSGEWQRSKPPTGTTRSYAYYSLLVEALEQQQERLWRSLHCKRHAASPNQAPLPCNIVGARDAAVATVEGDSCVFDVRQQRAVRELVWRGIPMVRRPELYSRMSGASVVQARFPPEYFLGLTQRLEDPTDEAHARPKSARFAAAKKQIQVDLKRTFAGNDECWLASSMGQRSMERVLLAYALHNDELGYCQSMTFVVGRLLCLCHARTPSGKTELPIEEEERVFWLLHVICEGLFPAYYTQGMVGLQVDGAVLEKLVRARLPKLQRHFHQLHAPSIGLVLVTQWLLPLCCAVFPSETSFRFLDVLFFEGSSAVFAMAIALLRVSQHELLAENVDYTQLFRFLRARDQRLHDASLLMEVALDEHQQLAEQIGPLRRSAARELGIGQADQVKAASRTKLSSLPVNELRPGDVDINI